MLKITHVMTKDVAKVSTNTTLHEAAALFRQQSLKRAAVVDSTQRLVGVLEIDSFLKAMLGAEDISQPVLNFMNKSFHVISQEQSVDLLANAQVETAWVIDNRGYLVGFLEKADILAVSGRQTKDAVNHYPVLEEAGCSRLNVNGVVGNSREMKNVLELAGRVARVDSTVLLVGETGVGKEIIAKVIQMNSARADAPFVRVNCGAIPHDLLESELFGYEKGSFTGAGRNGKIGMFEVANEGTILLDEIGEMSLALQVKLLRVLQEQEIVRLGGVNTVKLNVRVITATNQDLTKLVKENKFRKDLYYRLNVVPIFIPALRQRPEDIIPLTSYFTRKYNEKFGFARRFSGKVLELFERYSWPGNVRELENMVERLVVMSEEEIVGVKCLPESFMKVIESSDKSMDKPPITVNGVMPLKDALVILEKELLTKALGVHRTTRKAARALGVDHSTVVRKANKHSIGLSGGGKQFSHH